MTILLVLLNECGGWGSGSSSSSDLARRKIHGHGRRNEEVAEIELSNVRIPITFRDDF